MKHPLALIATPKSRAGNLIAFHLKSFNVPFDTVDITHVGYVYLARRMKRENKLAPALMYRNQIVSVTPRKSKIQQALQDWGLI